MNPASVPGTLKARPQWIVYKVRRNGEKTDKIPVDHRTGKAHDAHDPAIWMSFEDASEAAAEFDGVGFVFAETDPFTGIDLDKCVGPDGTLEPWAEQVVDCFGSYAELSPSGTGVHILIVGKLPPGVGHKVNGQGADGRGKIEVYDRKRFFTVTGNRLGEVPEIYDRQEEFAAFCRARMPFVDTPAGPAGVIGPSRLDDEEVLRMARSTWPLRFGKLFDDGDLSDYDGDQSRADMALLNFLAFYTGSNARQLDRLFRKSALMRDKWDRKLGASTYGAVTIAKVLGTAKASYHAATEGPEPSRATKEDADDEPIVVRASTIEPRAVEWLWPNRIPRKFISIFAGQTSVGKSFVSLDIVARVTTGGEWPDLPGECAPMGNVLIISEDGQSTVNVPRLIAMGADLDKVFFMTWAAMGRFTLTNTSLLAQAVGMSEDPILIVIDPPSNFMGAIDEHKNSEVRSALMFLVAWLENYHVPIALLFITHVNKNAKGIDAINRVIGSIAWMSTARVGFVLTRDPDQPGRNLFLMSKSNIGPLIDGVAFRVVPAEICGGIKTGRLEWLGSVNTSADDAVNGEKKKPVKPCVMEWLAERFREKRTWRAKDLERAAYDAGYSYSSVFKEAPFTPSMIRKRKITEPGRGSYSEWRAQPGWPPENRPESSESSESSDATPCGETENQTFGTTSKVPESSCVPESSSEQLSDQEGTTFGTTEGSPESWEKPRLPALYDPTFGTFGSFGSPPAGAGEEVSDPRRALQFLAGILQLDQEFARSDLMAWAWNRRITEAEILAASESLGVTKTLDGGIELWKLESHL